MSIPTALATRSKLDPEPTRTTALWIALMDITSAGIRVHPVHTAIHDGARPRCSCNKPNCTSVGKHPRLDSWQERATTDLDQLVRWWARWPHANVGIAPGRTATPGRFLVVLDLDGPEAMQSIADSELHLPLTYEVKTGRSEGDGRHLYYLTDHPLTDAVGGLHSLGIRKVDVRGRGNVVGAGSLHASGRTYEPNGSASELLIELPADLRDLLRDHQGTPPASKHLSTATSAAAAHRPVDLLHGRVVLPANLSDELQRSFPHGERSEPAFGALLQLVVLTEDDDAVANEMLIAPLGERYHERPRQDLYDEVHRARIKVSPERKAEERRRFTTNIERLIGLAREHLRKSPGSLRVLLGLTSIAQLRGFNRFAASYDEIAIECARTARTVRDQLQRLEAEGWIERSAPPGGNYASRYRLTIPPTLRGQDPHPSHTPCAGAGDVRSPLTVGSALDLSSDSSRWQASHSLWLVLENLSDSEAITVADLAKRLQRHPRSIRRYRTRLVEHGLIHDRQDLMLVPDWRDIWDDVAILRGTDGMKEEAILAREEKVLHWKRWRLVDDNQAVWLGNQVAVKSTGEVI